MKYTGIILPVYLLLPAFLSAQAGSSCTSPIPLPLDGTCGTYAISSSTDNSAICSYGTLHVTYFSFTATSSQCILMNINGPDGSPVEAALYAGSPCNNGNLKPYSSICFNDGKGIWAPALYVNGTLVSPPDVVSGSTYILRIQTTATTGNISLCAQYYTPPNDDCNGATNIGSNPITDNNACHTAGPGVTAIDLAASTLENTAFYKYTVANTGNTTITLSNIECDNSVNSADGSNVGFQVGIFTGNCSSLTSLGRFTDNISFEQRTYSLTAGTNVYIAIDGTSGSNCKYTLTATNSIPLPAYIKYFTAWKTSSSNVLKWVSLQEINNDRFEIQRSENGRNFNTIGKMKGELYSSLEKNYSFEDAHPPMKCFYRLKQVDIDGHEIIFKTIEVIRTDLPYISLSFQNPISDNLLLNIQTNVRGQAELKVTSMNGTVMLDKQVKVNKGDNSLFANLSMLPAGRYVLSLEGGNAQAARTFVKTNASSGRF